VIRQSSRLALSLQACANVLFVFTYFDLAIVATFGQGGIGGGTLETLFSGRELRRQGIERLASGFGSCSATLALNNSLLVLAVR